MADETIASGTLKTSIIVAGEKDVINQYTEIYKLGADTDMIAGQIVTLEGETAPEIDIHSTAQAVLGILLGYANENDIKASYSLGVTIGQNKLVKVLRRTGGRVKVGMVLNRADSVSNEVEVGNAIFPSPTDDGKVTHVSPDVGTDDVGIAADLFLGRSASNVGVAVTADKLIFVWY